MYLFIFESLGTSELIMIGIVALIFLGPRRLPELARKAGKIMSELRGTANEFKQTWEREVDFEEETKALKIDDLLNEADEDKPVSRENKILSDSSAESTPIDAPAIKAMNKEEFDAIAAGTVTEPESSNGHHESSAESSTEEEPDLLSDKRNWL
ncbi:MAG: Sec-independent protein translocase protein TatB [bacterium]|nr:Sec-independent protein translocase protein TatB [bacterium]